MLETGLALLLLVAVTLPLTIAIARAKPAQGRWPAFAGFAIVVAGVAWLAASYAPPKRLPPTDRPLELAHEGYVSSRACKACHPEEYASWHRSYHRTMTQPANTDTVLGPIDGVVVNSRGRPFFLERRGKEVWVQLDDPEWTGTPPQPPRVWRQIVQTTGSHNEQFYWIASGKSRQLTILPIMFRLLDEQRWESLDACCITTPGHVQESGMGRWNRVCNRCHATHALPRIDQASGVMDTHMAEFGIACEACHGPGGPHAELQRDPRKRYAQHFGEEAEVAIVDPSKLPKERSAEICGQCHSISGFHDDPAREQWRREGFPFRPGQVLADTRPLLASGDDHFWPDGMIRVSGREYNGLVRSPCFERGDMSCLSCHAMHPDADDPRSLDEWANDQLKPGMDGDLACTQCHAGFETPEKVAAHTHHAPGSAGSQCMNCHMPYTTTGLLKGIRAHQVSSPSVQESLVAGRPNACSSCHLDRTLAWVAAELERWYGIAPPELGADERTFAAGPLWALRGDAGQRNLMAWTMGWEPARAAAGTDWMTPYLTTLLRDPYSSVRMIARRTIAKQPEGNRLVDYDPMGTFEHWQAKTDPVYVAWAARKRAASAALLIGADNGLDNAPFMDLLSRRDNKPMALNE